MKALHLSTGSVLSFRDRKTLSPFSLTRWWRWCALNSNCSVENSWHYISMSNVSAREYFVAAGVFCLTQRTRHKYATAFIHWFHSHFLILVICSCSSTCKHLVNLDQCCFQLHMETTSRSLCDVCKKFLNKCAFLLLKSSPFFPCLCLILPFHPSKQCLHHFIRVRKLWKMSFIVSQSPRWPSRMSVYVLQIHQIHFFLCCKTEKG